MWNAGMTCAPTPERCPECNTAVSGKRTVIDRWKFLLGPMGTIVAAMVIVLIGDWASTPLWRKVNFNRWTRRWREYADMTAFMSPSHRPFMIIAREHHVLPANLEYLEPGYLTDLPHNLEWDGNRLRVSIGLDYMDLWVAQLATYDFNSKDEQWITRGDLGEMAIPLPRLSATRPATSQARSIELRLADFDARIAHGTAYRTGDTDWQVWNRGGKICLLINQGRIPEALAQCQKSGKEMPDWWFPQMVMAEYAPAKERDASLQKFADWVDLHQTFFHFWCLAQTYRDLGRDNDAFAMLGRALSVKADRAEYGYFGYEGFVDEEDVWLDAMLYAYQKHQYRLAIDLSGYGSSTFWMGARYTFASASELSLGQFAAAHRDIAAVQPAWCEGLQNVEKLRTAINANDSAFIFDPGGPWLKWNLIMPPDSEEFYRQNAVGALPYFSPWDSDRWR